jgi:hypothetical protein
MRRSWFDDFERCTHLVRLLLSLSPARLADHHVGPFRLDPESLRGVGSVLREDGVQESVLDEKFYCCDSQRSRGNSAYSQRQFELNQ